MKTIFLKGLDAKDEAEMKQSFVSALPMRKKLTEILENKIRIQHRWQASGDYDNANWAHKQADAMGYIRAMEEMISLVSLEKIEPQPPKGRGRPAGKWAKPKPINVHD